ncbi:MAG: prepilin peptidase [Anaerocolumna aminovalerica]|jgi:leader peptidase (prepilin peptidase)/N-methyltransferase|uniref:prepilin peptidase n=1 Tax=Anaerocolumna aminovalerica TaxID=1527 RepID=UPI00248B0C40|nr:prepilin peptidase [Anaerocolumna aminovalerica]MDU6266067.1 prepilin peptidase [Anaerocolumna aminovalerica]
MNQLHITYTILFLWLLLCSIQDIKKKKINIYLILAGLAGFFVLLISMTWNGEFNFLFCLGGMSLGLILLCLSFITKGQIGTGDGLIVCITGLCLGFSRNAMLLAVSLLASAIFSIVLLTFKLAGRKKTIPFVPFLLIGYLGVLFFG